MFSYLKGLLKILLVNIFMSFKLFLDFNFLSCYVSTVYVIRDIMLLISYLYFQRNILKIYQKVKRVGVIDKISQKWVVTTDLDGRFKNRGHFSPPPIMGLQLQYMVK